MRILILTQWFEPEPAFKGLPFAKELQRRGHQVEVLTGFPNYPYGKIYKGYSVKLFQRQIMDGISIIRVPLYPNHDSSSIKRIINYLSFAVSSSLLGPFLIKKPDVIYVYHPPASIAIPAIFFKYLLKSPFVYDIQDLWPDTLMATGMVNNGFILKIVNLFCQFIYRQANAIIVLSPGFKRQLINRNVKKSKINLIYNWTEETKTPKIEDITNLKKKYQFEKKFNIVFAGNMGKAQALEYVLEVANLLKSKYSDIQFVFIGDGIETENLKLKKRQNNLDNVQFIGRVGKNEIKKFLHASDALLVHLKKDELFKITIPSKLQAYFESGKPVIAGIEGDAADLVILAGAGVVCTPEGVEGILKEIIGLYNVKIEKREVLGWNGKRFYERNMSFDSGMNQTENILKSICYKKVHKIPDI